MGYTSQHILFLTGKLAEKQLRQLLKNLPADFIYTVHELGLKVAALMTTDMIKRRLKNTFGADKIIIPGRCRGDIDCLSAELGIPVERGPNELKDLPMFFGADAYTHDLSKYKVKIFAEIVNSPHISVEEIVKLAWYYKNNGADVIDIGCIPETKFSHMKDAISTLKQEGFTVSIDSMVADDLLEGAKAGADYMLSLTNKSLWVANEVDAIPILIPEKHGDLSSLEPAISILQKQNKAFIVDPILDPIHFGFTQSIVHNFNFRQQYPDIEMMLGIGNITELTHADTSGINALLLGICSELNINHILTTEVSQHANRAIKEADCARRIMLAAQQNNMLPKHINDNLMMLHDLHPFPYDKNEIAEFAALVTDPSFRIQTSHEGIHIYNRSGINTSTDPFALFKKIQIKDDVAHAFYLGVELSRAEISWQLGKRFNQDCGLDWGCAAKSGDDVVDTHIFKPKPTDAEKKK